MASIKKAGVTFYPVVDIGPDITGLAATFTFKYKLQSATDWIVVPGTFVEMAPGAYTIPVTVATAGLYHVRVETTEETLEDVSDEITVTSVNIDDINAAIAAAQADITAIKGQVDTLDEAALNTVQTKVDGLAASLASLETLLLDDSNPAIVSLKELIQTIVDSQSVGKTVLDALTSYTDDIENAIMGSDTLKDGSVNPFKDKTGHHIYDLLVTTSQYLGGAITTAQSAIVADAQATRDLVLTKIAAVKAVVDSNASSLSNVGYGLPALKILLDDILSNTAGGTQSVIDVLNDSENGLVKIKSLIELGFAGVNTKLDTISSKLTSSRTTRLIA